MSKIVFPAGAYMYLSCKTYRHGSLTDDVSGQMLSGLPRNEDGEFMAADLDTVLYTVNFWRDGNSDRRLYMEYYD